MILLNIFLSSLIVTNPAEEQKPGLQDHEPSNQFVEEPSIQHDQIFDDESKSFIESTLTASNSTTETFEMQQFLEGLGVFVFKYLTTNFSHFPDFSPFPIPIQRDVSDLIKIMKKQLDQNSPWSTILSNEVVKWATARSAELWFLFSSRLNAV